MTPEAKLRERDNFRPWTLPDALRTITAIRPIFDMSGWMIALYGSLLGRIDDQTGIALAHGIQTPRKDLDLIAVPRVTEPLPPSTVVSGLFQHLGIEAPEQPYYGVLDTEAYWLLTQDHQLIDVQFRERIRAK
jgi:hypothetical protein